MKKVYIVTAGYYSSYHICGVFETRYLANKYIKTFSGENSYSEMGIETWSINPLKKELAKGYKPFFLRMTKDGTSSDIRFENSDYGFNRGSSFGFDVRGDMYNHCLAKDEKHAIKITNELRARLIAENKWKGITK